MFKRTLWVLVSVLLVASMLLSACNGEEPTEQMTEEPTEEMTEEPTEEMTEEPTPTEEMAEETEEAMPTEEMEEEMAFSCEEDISGETVNVLAVWGGDELESFEAMVAPWEEATGAMMDYEGTRDLNAVLTTRVEGGNPPDIAGLPGPGQLRQYADEGYLVDLSTFMDMEMLQEDYADTWIDLATFDGGLYGIFTKAAIKSLVWYSPPNFEEAGYEIPEESWDEMMELSQTIIDDGNAPWCLGLESGAASGWPGTDWIEDIMLRTAGPEVYDQWWQHEIPWTDEAVRNAWEIFGQVATDGDMVQGGTTAVLATGFGESVYPMLQEPPGCYMHRQAIFIQSFIQDQFPDAQPIEDFDYFAFPPIDEQYGTPALVAGDLFGLFNDEPAARCLMRWLATDDAQSIWAERGGFIATNRNVAPEIYPDQLTQQAAEVLVEADVVRFDASDLMPSAVNDAFWSGILEYVENPDQLDSILQNIESVAEENY
ncbi:MAG: ABC transporter substrate-binding protein [Anaerolineales bacterium]